jgi:hypothetical protein
MVVRFTERLVIKASFTSDDVDFVSMQRGWVLEGHRLPDGEAFVDIWKTLDGKTEIRQVDAQFIGTRYFTLRGFGSAEVARHLRQDCDLWTTGEALGELRKARSRNETLRLVYAAAVSAAEEDGAQVAQEFRAVVQNPDAGIRQSVIIATGFFPHPDLVELVRALGDSDPVDHVRRNAQLLLTGLSESG